jgi:hypothetical protein
MVDHKETEAEKKAREDKEQAEARQKTAQRGGPSDSEVGTAASKLDDSRNVPRSAGDDGGDDVTNGISDEIQGLIDRTSGLMNDEQTNHPSISIAITRLKEAQQALHEYRAKRGKLPRDQFPEERNRGDNPA